MNYVFRILLNSIDFTFYFRTDKYLFILHLISLKFFLFILTFLSIFVIEGNININEELSFGPSIYALV